MGEQELEEGFVESFDSPLDIFQDFASLSNRRLKGANCGQSNRLVRYTGLGSGPSGEVLLGSSRRTSEKRAVSRRNDDRTFASYRRRGRRLFVYQRRRKTVGQGIADLSNASGRLDAAIDAVVPNGGKVIKPKHPIGPYGHRAIILDSEGNRVALHSD